MCVSFTIGRGVRVSASHQSSDGRSTTSFVSTALPYDNCFTVSHPTMTAGFCWWGIARTEVAAPHTGECRNFSSALMESTRFAVASSRWNANPHLTHFHSVQFDQSNWGSHRPYPVNLVFRLRHLGQRGRLVFVVISSFLSVQFVFQPWQVRALMRTHDSSTFLSLRGRSSGSLTCR